METLKQVAPEECPHIYGYLGSILDSNVTIILHPNMWNKKYQVRWPFCPLCGKKLLQEGE